MKQRFTILEAFFLLIGTGIIVQQIMLTRGELSLQELGAVLFCYGYVISSVADREDTRGPVDFLKSVAEIIRAIRGQGKDDS